MVIAPPADVVALDETGAEGPLDDAELEVVGFVVVTLPLATPTQM